MWLHKTSCFVQSIFRKLGLDVQLMITPEKPQLGDFCLKMINQNNLWQIFWQTTQLLIKCFTLDCHYCPKIIACGHPKRPCVCQKLLATKSPIHNNQFNSDADKTESQSSDVMSSFVSADHISSGYQNTMGSWLHKENIGSAGKCTVQCSRPATVITDWTQETQEGTICRPDKEAACLRKQCSHVDFSSASSALLQAPELHGIISTLWSLAVCSSSGASTKGDQSGAR